MFYEKNFKSKIQSVKFVHSKMKAGANIVPCRCFRLFFDVEGNRVDESMKRLLLEQQSAINNTSNKLKAFPSESNCANQRF